MLIHLIILEFLCVNFGFAQKDPLFVGDRNTIVHLFEWKWTDIASECENFLSKKKFGGVQISPPSENLIVKGRPWYERYQPVSFNLTTRSGDVNALRDMIRRCNAVGIRIYVDVLLNDMAGQDGIGTAQNLAFGSNKTYPAVPFTNSEFHPTCDIDYKNATSIRICELAGLKDLNQSVPHVRKEFINYLNALIDLGVAGFRVDAAKHIFPEDLEYIFGQLKDLNETYFAKGTRAYIYQEVTDDIPDAVSNTEYTDFGRVIEFKHGLNLGSIFQGTLPNKSLSDLKTWGTQWGLLDGNDTLVMIDNHDTQRSGGETILNYKKSKAYKAATAFMLAHNYTGTTRILSSFNFSSNDDGPPNQNETIISPKFDKNGESCTNGWICEHRWNSMVNMVEFKTIAMGTNITNWWSNGKNQIAFSRGSKAFIAFNIEGNLTEILQTGLKPGLYCDIISGKVDENQTCTGKYIFVNKKGQAYLNILETDNESVFATHINATGLAVNGANTFKLNKLFLAPLLVSLFIWFNF